MGRLNDVYCVLCNGSKPWGIGVIVGCCSHISVTLVVKTHESNKMKIVSNNEYTNDNIKIGADTQIDNGE